MSKNWSKVGWAALSAAITAAITYSIKAVVNHFSNKSNSNVQTKAAMVLEDHKLENAKELEKKKTEERKKRLEDEEEHRRKMNEIAEEQRRKHRESQQAAQEQVNGDSSLDTAPNLRSSASVFTRPSGFGPKAWLVDGYAKPGQITLVVAGGGVGKSTLLLQIAKAVANGERAEFLPDSCCASLKQDVVYYRIEDFPDELEGKYGKGKVFDGLNIQWVLPEDLGVNSLSAFLDHVKRLAHKLERDTLVCVDPATKLDGHSHEACIKGLEDAQKIAKANSVTLSFIVAAHVDEIKDWKHLTTENIKGGDKGVQQAGAVIALRKEGTPGDNHRFIQCLKAPKGHPAPFPEGVLVCKYVKTQLDGDNWYLHFEHVEIKPEKKALPKKPKTIKEDDKTETGNAVSNMTTEVPKKTKRRLTAEEKAEVVMLLEQKVKSPVIAKQFKISLRTVQRIAKEARA